MNDTPKYEVGGHLIDAHGNRHKITAVYVDSVGILSPDNRTAGLSHWVAGIARYEPPKPKAFEWLPPHYDMLRPRNGMTLRESINAWMTEKYGKPVDVEELLHQLHHDDRPAETVIREYFGMPPALVIRFTEADRLKVLRLHPGALWLAMDKNGDAFSYDVDINPEDEHWIVCENCKLEIHPSLRNYADDWLKSLIDLTIPVGGEV